MRKEECELVEGGSVTVLRPETKEDVQKLVKDPNVDVSEREKREKPGSLKKNFKVGWTDESRAGALARRKGGTAEVKSPISREAMEKKFGRGPIKFAYVQDLKVKLYIDFLAKDEEAARSGAEVMSHWYISCNSPGGSVLQSLAAKRWGEGTGVTDSQRRHVSNELSVTTLDVSALDRFMSWEKTCSGYLLDRLYPGKESVTLYRGTERCFKGAVTLDMRSLSSWTADFESAKVFAEVKGGSVLKSSVKKSRVFSVFERGEREFILVGAKALKAEEVPFERGSI